MTLAGSSSSNPRRIRGVVIVAWAVGAVSLLVLVLHLFVAVHVMGQRRAQPPVNLGNGPAVIARLPFPAAPDQSFSFAIIGDVNRGVATFERVMQRVLAETNLSFLILLGDCASDPTRPDHDYFREEFAESGQTLPTFIVAGNHDVQVGRFEKEEFEQLYGPVDFNFVYGNCLFIGLGTGVLHGHQDEAVAYLERTLAAERAKVSHVFVFMHYPPMAALRAPQEKLFTHPEQFIELFDRYKVDYVISGHHHRLARTEDKATTYLTSGGGGARLREDEYGQSGLFHHAIVFQVSGESIEEQVHMVRAAGVVKKYWEKWERWLTGDAWPLEKHHLALTLGANLVALLGLVFSLRIFWRRRSKPVAA
jgi:predicted phosphodiesterase